MRKILATLMIASLLSASSVAPAFADGYYYGSVNVYNPLWPVAVALAIPAAILGSVANAFAPVPVGYGYAVSPAPVVYSGPAPYYVHGPYYAPRVYVGPSGYYYAPRVYYHY